jgi:type IV secretory pathway protease TraF
MNKTLLYILAAFTFIVLFAITHFTINESPSMPIGLYRFTHGPFQRGALVLLKDPLKEIAAVPGDTVEWDEDGVYVNGSLLNNSAVPSGSPYPPYPHMRLKLVDGQYLTMAHNPLSYDGRYLGPTPESLIATTVQPLWTKK